MTGSNGFRTYTVIRAIRGVPVTCGAMIADEPHVMGRLAGDPSDGREPVWLEADGGRRLSIIWPEGFKARFEPTLLLYDDTGKVKARAGDWIEFNQSANDHSGTFEDPYPAAWFLDEALCRLYVP